MRILEPYLRGSVIGLGIALYFYEYAWECAEAHEQIASAAAPLAAIGHMVPEHLPEHRLDRTVIAIAARGVAHRCGRWDGEGTYLRQPTHPVPY
jgi:hypothetical protein